MSFDLDKAYKMWIALFEGLLPAADLANVNLVLQVDLADGISHLRGRIKHDGDVNPDYSRIQ